MAFEFVKAFFKHPRQVGSIVESSAYMARALMAPVDFAVATTLVELGSGTGSVTKHIVQRMRQDARLFVFEIDPALVARLRHQINDSRVTIIEGSAEQLSTHLAAHGAASVDAIISCLPVVTLPAPVTEKIWREIEATLVKGGVYVQLQLSLVFLRKMRKRFAGLRVRFEPRNIPPGFAFIYQKTL